MWRFEGSDPARFSPKLAWHMVQRAADVSQGRGVLWDPFCGVGLIPCVARAFFAADFAGVCASDISDRAVQVTRRNLQMLADPSVAEQRRSQLRGLSRQNAKSKARWGAVEDYLLRLAPHVEQAASDQLNVQVRCGSVDEVHTAHTSMMIVCDAPYGRMSTLVGPPLPELLERLMRRDNVVYIDMVVTAEQARQATDRLPELTAQPSKSGRFRLLYASA